MDRMEKPNQAPIERRKLSHQIEERLLTELQSGQLLPGDLLASERELMALYGVGRPAIREAMQNLERMGLIEIRHGERPRVAQPSFERTLGQLGETIRHVLFHSESSLEHLKQARVMFEMEMARVAAREAQPEHLRILRRILEEQKQAMGPSTTFLELDGRFHLELARVSGNPIFSALSEALFGWLAQFHAHLVRSPGHEHLTLQEHLSIVEAVERHDENLAVKCMADHLNRANALYNVKNAARPVNEGLPR
jgi:GntR family transcriptional regulator, sialic acid-inducible nan operon repressor